MTLLYSRYHIRKAHPVNFQVQSVGSDGEGRALPPQDYYISMGHGKVMEEKVCLTPFGLPLNEAPQRRYGMLPCTDFA